MSATVTPADIEALFVKWGVNPWFGAKDGEIPAERYVRIANEVNSGTRTFESVGTALEKLAGKSVTPATIEALFSKWGVDPSFGAKDGESASQRYVRIANEVNSGTRTFESVGTALEKLAGRSGTVSGITPADIEALFRKYNIDPAFKARDGETPNQRYVRIANEVTSGTRTLESVSTALRKLAGEGAPAYVENPTEVNDPKDFYSRILAIFPGMPRDFIEAVSVAWAANADYGMDVAVATLRQDTRYESWFPGNLAPDGTVHLTEGQYWQTRREYEDVIRQIGVNPGVFGDNQYVDLIRGDVDVSEWQGRIRELSNNILATADDYGLREYYAELYDLDSISDGTILESAFSGNADAIRRQVGKSIVGFEGELRGFDINLQLASSLYDSNVKTQGQAQELFGDAAEKVPLFGRLAERHFDQDDDFDLGEYLEAAVFDDQEQFQRMNRLLSAERAMYGTYRPLRQRGDAAIGLLAT